MMKRIILITLLSFYFLNANAIPAFTGRGCVDNEGRIFQIRKMSNGVPVTANGVAVYQNFNPLTEMDGLCYDTAPAGVCIIDGIKTRFKAVQVNVVECPLDDYIIPLALVVILVSFPLIRKQFLLAA